MRELDKKIKSQKKSLVQLEEQIKSAQAAREKLKEDEDSLARTLRALDSEIERSVKKQVNQRRMIQENEKNMKQLTQEIALLSDEGKMWEGAVLTDLRSYHEQVIFPLRLVTDPMAAWALRAIIGSKVRQMNNIQVRRVTSLEREEELTKSKRKLVHMKGDLEAEVQKQKKSQAEKSRLHKTTQGKRIIAEQEVQRLGETRDAMESLIAKLTERRKQTLAAQREAELAKKSFHEKRGNLPWPAEGPILSQFGRQKHPDLNIIVINSGIKIKTVPQCPVQAVAKGTVIYASDFRSYGQTVIVDHGGETYSVYGLLGEIGVKEGEKVIAGKLIGAAPDDAAAQIYFEIKNQGRSENPLLWLIHKEKQ